MDIERMDRVGGGTEDGDDLGRRGRDEEDVEEVLGVCWFQSAGEGVAEERREGVHGEAGCHDWKGGLECRDEGREERLGTCIDSLSG